MELGYRNAATRLIFSIYVLPLLWSFGVGIFFASPVQCDDDFLICMNETNAFFVGKIYNTTRVLFSDATFNETAYKDYSPLFLPYVPPSKSYLLNSKCLFNDLLLYRISFAVSYGITFAAITATIVHAILYFRKPISVHLHRSLKEQPDIHAQLMAQYPQGR